MSTDYSVMGAYSDGGAPSAVSAPGDMQKVIAELDEIVKKYEMGNILSDEDKGIVSSYLPIIGADETSIADNGALVGGGKFSFDRSELGCDVHAEGDLNCKYSGEGRIEMYAEMATNKTGGEGNILGYRFAFQGAGFGVGPTGALKVIWKRSFAREFPASDSATVAFIDRYTLEQKGFYFSFQCDVLTALGAFPVR